MFLHAFEVDGTIQLSGRSRLCGKTMLESPARCEASNHSWYSHTKKKLPTPLTLYCNVVGTLRRDESSQIEPTFVSKISLIVHG